LIGGITAQAKTEQIDGFRDKAFDVMLCQVKIAEGFNLTRSQDVIFYGRDWSPAINAQAEDRCHRMGQTGTVQYQIPVVTNTIERLIHNRLATKDADAQQALRTLDRC
jgi:SNF2 family DNA or RNA helicase